MTIYARKERTIDFYGNPGWAVSVEINGETKIVVNCNNARNAVHAVLTNKEMEYESIKELDEETFDAVLT